MEKKQNSSTTSKKIFLDRFFDNSSKQLDSFGTVLVLTLLSVAVLLLANLGLNMDKKINLAVLIVNFTVGLTLIYSLRASGLARRYLNPITILIVISILVSILIFTLNYFRPGTISLTGFQGISPIWVFFFFFTPLASTWRLLHHKQVTINTLYAAISSYLQIAIAFAFMYLLIASNSTELFFGQIQSTTSYMYYSLTTISTVGYGDLYTTNEIGRALSASEAIIGQIYLVVLVAMLVGIFVNSKNK